MNEPTVFKPHALVRVRIIRESRLIRDLTMKEQDWRQYDAPASDRLDARSVCASEFNKQE